MHRSGYVKQCHVCNEVSPSQAREPMMDHVNQPELPFQQTVTDLFEKSGHHYLVYADRYFGWVEIAHITTTDAKRVTNCLWRWFCTYGVPEELSSDGDPPFNSDDYERFTDNWGVRRRLSSAYFPQSNGRAEAAVKTAKRFMTNNVDRFGTLNTDGIAQAMLLHRNTPVQDVGISQQFCCLAIQFEIICRIYWPSKRYDPNGRKLETFERNAIRTPQRRYERTQTTRYW